MEAFVITIKGLVLGLSLAAPVGPIGILCINRSLQFGRMHGFVSGLGAAVADGIYASLAAFGLTVITGFLVRQGYWLNVVGCAFLLYMALSILLKKKMVKSMEVKRSSGAAAFLSTLVLTITNPMTILTFFTVFSGIGYNSTSYVEGILLVGGVVLGSTLWWLLLSFGVSFLKTRMSTKVLKAIDLVSAALLLALASYSFTKLI
jgi:threonine/homoserine/homoserine lactone efflux protein